MELGSFSLGDYLASALEETAETKEAKRSGQPSPMATFRKMYPRLRDSDIHLFELGDHVYEWVDGWRVNVWFRNGHVEIIKDRNARDPRWARYLWPSFPAVWSRGGRVSNWSRLKGMTQKYPSSSLTTFHCFFNMAISNPLETSAIAY